MTGENKEELELATESPQEPDASEEVVAGDAEISEEVIADDTESAEETAAEEATVIGAQELIGDDSAHGEFAAAAEIGSYSDLLIEGLSVESNVQKVVKYIRIPEKVAQYLFAVLYLVVGALCIAMPHHIEFALPYIVGGGMAAMAVVTFIFAIATKEYRSTHTNKTAMSVILLGLSIMIILEHEWAHTFIPIVWGVLGLFEGAHAFNHALSRISRGMRCSYYIIKGVIEVVVAFLLLYRPEQYGELHIIVFGVSLIVDGITTAPIIKKFVTRR